MVMGAELEEASDWEFPEAVRPNPEELGFDLDQALASVVALKAMIPQDAFTASILGTERAGNGVVIRANGLVLTIGYLITEAEQVWLTAADGAATPAHVVAYDQGTGLGLVQALSRLNVPAIEIGSAKTEAREGAEVIVAGHGGRRHAMNAQVIARQEFAGYWEYVIDDAIFTAPAHPDWGGTALIGTDGKLTGIGSLFLEQGGDEDSGVKANMVVPIDLLPPILDDLLRFGRVNRPPRPWLGMYTARYDDGLVVAGLAPGGPAEDAGIHRGDEVVEVDGDLVGDLAQMFRKVWALGPAGTSVPLAVQRDGTRLAFNIRSIDRNALLKQPQLH